MIREINQHTLIGCIKSIIKFAFLISLLFSFTNYVFISVSFLFLIPLLVLTWPNFFLFRHPKFLILIGFYLVLVIISTLVYNMESFLEFDFYRRDGNIFISYLPILILALIPIDFNVPKILKVFVVSSTCLCILGVFFGGSENGTYHLFFIAHNAAGGFVGVIIMFTLGLYSNEKRKKYLILLILQFWILYLTDSRGSWLGVMLGIGSIMFVRTFENIILITSIIFMIVLNVFAYDVWKKVDGSSNTESFAIEGTDLNLNIPRAGTFILRIFYLWPRGLDNFLHSPIYGLGFGSYDDRPYEYVEVMPFQFKKENQTIRHTSSHAHNSFINILSELGLIGFILFLAILYYLRKFILNQIQNPSVRNAMFLAFWMIIYSSYTEHRIVTPSQMLPFTVVLGMILSNHYYVRTKHKGDKLKHKSF